MKERRPDLAAVCEYAASRFVLLGECTLEKPHSKFTPLKARTAELQGLLGSWADVVPVVFTACEPAAGDFASASADGIILVGQEKLSGLLRLVATGPKPKEVLEFLRMMSIF